MKTIKQLFGKHPFIVAWVALAIGMVAILLWASQGAGLLPNQLAAIVAATVVLAAGCVWIISWE
ncbi:MAG: hypothetical protein M1343_02755 [Chloroflexi bacterium]|nr:hypothetical protein [Chloroflexota bacterium]MDA8189872.1 hypothetical protein [Dehalococcoidales bacterium]